MRGDRERLADMLESCQRIAHIVGLGRQQFESDSIVQDALIRRLEVLGEAAGRLGADVRNGHPEVPWRQVIGMRNRAVHGYFDIDLDQVWVAAETAVPALAAQLRKILEEG